jgi:hypothetical protein
MWGARKAIQLSESGGGVMQRRIERWLKWWCLAGTGTGVALFQAQGCSVDPDIWLRAGITFGSDAAIFLLENLAASL